MPRWPSMRYRSRALRALVGPSPHTFAFQVRVCLFSVTLLFHQSFRTTRIVGFAHYGSFGVWELGLVPLFRPFTGKSQCARYFMHLVRLVVQPFFRIWDSAHTLGRFWCLQGHKQWEELQSLVHLLFNTSSMWHIGTGIRPKIVLTEQEKPGPSGIKIGRSTYRIGPCCALKTCLLFKHFPDDRAWETICKSIELASKK